MYYLLEDNRIIETKKEYGLEYITEYEFVYVKDLHYQGLQVIKNVTTEKIIGVIKKQSENVWDLIEVGDLVAQKKYFDSKEIYYVSSVYGKDDKLIKCFHCTMFEDNVVAIYKPNEKGDYIKVWEKKNG